jgi:hypothetical protein
VAEIILAADSMAEFTALLQIEAVAGRISSPLFIDHDLSARSLHLVAGYQVDDGSWRFVREELEVPCGVAWRVPLFIARCRLYVLANRLDLPVWPFPFPREGDRP